jgi:biotin carboxyl carrier protein
VQYELEVNGHVRTVTVNRHADHFVIGVGDRRWTVDVARVGSHTLSLLIDRDLDRTREKPSEHRRPAAVVAARHSDRRGAGAQQTQVSGPVNLVDSHEITIASDPLTGQFVFGIGPLPLSVGLNTRRRWGRADDGAQRGSGPQRLVAPMPGKIVRILAAPGQTVHQRQPVVVIEAMKMENELRALRDGTVADVLVQEGQSVEAGMLLAIITPS